ncbi:MULTISPECIES: acyl-CoA dehydrogenase family protein [unclassified Mycobacterium]|uniref:acyl-CoA dehydrogenase family protein n=1 Tax=unclassified Mycobacterium TaxID=2642494 RepID=UPI00073FE053|nr:MULTISPECIES: acyl-CoA dehydrogenase family protein [unclassified Mycobacterium]KUH85918.1 hypothetical protein AU185_11640 [Mycobacterium sp. GA-0227b]KUH89382.1 hypothetical protein AU187_09670 [Mycobacterium sp. IS-1556]
MSIGAAGPTLGQGADGTSPGLQAELIDWLRIKDGLLREFREPVDTLAEDVEGLRRFQQLLYNAGWLRKGWPAQFGGLGGSALDRGIIAETLTAAGFPLPFSFSMIEVSPRLCFASPMRS